MIDYHEINGNLITLAKEGYFDVIAHGCNCFSTMGAGIAPQMAKEFGCDKFKMERLTPHSFNKLGCIDFEGIKVSNKRFKILYVVNAYTQFNYKTIKNEKPIDYIALIMCFKKMNKIFSGRHIGLPHIGCGLAGGDIKKVKYLIKKYFADCKVTLVNYDNTI